MREGTPVGQGRRGTARRNATVTFDAAQLDVLDRLSYERDVSRSVLIRAAVDQFLAREAKSAREEQ